LPDYDVNHDRVAAAEALQCGTHSERNVRVHLNNIRRLAWLTEYKLRGLPKLVKFIFVGLSGSGVDLAAFSLWLLLLPVPLSRAVAIAFAMTWNFYWNRRWTFFDCRDRGLVWQYAAFCAACSLGALINWATCVTLWHFVPPFDRYPIAAAAIGIAAGVAFNFVASSRVVFRPSRPSRAAAVQAARTERVDSAAPAERPYRRPPLATAAARENSEPETIGAAGKS
jgi:putative flippase GtrA